MSPEPPVVQSVADPLYGPETRRTHTLRPDAASLPQTRPRSHQGAVDATLRRPILDARAVSDAHSMPTACRLCAVRVHCVGTWRDNCAHAVR
jgi:hypothetical protein